MDQLPTGESPAAHRDDKRVAPQPTAAGSQVEIHAQRIEAGAFYVNPTIVGRLGADLVAQAQYKVLAWADVDGRPVSTEEEQAVKASLILRHRRLLVLRGEPELGKATVALEVIRRAVDAPPDEVLEFHDLEATVNVPLETWAGDRAYRGRALVFKDAFAQGNASLRALGRRLSREHLDQLTQSFRRADMFVVLTSDTDRVPQEWEGVASELCCELSAPSHTLLRDHLDREIEQFADRPGHGPVSQLQLDDKQRDELLKAMRTIPRLIRFSRHYFHAIAAGRTTVTSALHDFDKLTHWFMVELRDRDPAAWCLAFALCLLEADPAVKRVPWAAMIQLAAMLARHLRHTIPSWKGRLPSFIDPDEALLGAARMEVVADATEDGDHVRFLGDRYGADLWRVLAQSGRALLWTIYPMLAAHAERRGSPLWVAAMTAIGRIGAIDGLTRLAAPLERLATSTEPIDHVALGRLLVGVLASGNTVCFEHCASTLRERAAGDAWPFMLAMREVGLGHLGLAVREMLGVTEQRIRPLLSGIETLNRMMLEALARRRDAVGPARESVELTRLLDRAKDEKLREIFGLIFHSEIVDSLDAARFAVIGLCLGRNPVEVCIALLPHVEIDSTIALSAPDRALGCIVAMLFFAGGPDAVFSVIDRNEFAIRAAMAGRHAPKLARVPVGLAADPSGRVAPFARFLMCTFDALSALPPAIGQPMKDRVIGCIKRWCRDAVRTAQTAPATRDLLCLLRAEAPASLGAAVTQLLKSDDDFRKPGSPLQTLAREVLTDTTVRARA